MQEIVLPSTEDLTKANIIFERQPSGLYMARWQEGIGGAASIAGVAVPYFWAGSGTTNAPSATNIRNGILGANAGGIPTANIYHVVNGVWVDTGAIVTNLYGG